MRGSRRSGDHAKSVTPDEARKCAATALEKNFPELGKSYVLAIPMVSLGPVTVIALGIGDNDGWGAYSCDPERKCNPVKLSAPSKWGKRMAERKAKACAEATTLWLPADRKACGDTPRPTAATPPTAPTRRRPPRSSRLSSYDVTTPTLARSVSRPRRRALRKMRIQGPSSRQARGRHENCTARKTRSGCGMKIVTRPSGVVSAVMPPGEPFGLSG